MDPRNPYDQARDEYVPCVFGLNQPDRCPRHANVWMTFGSGDGTTSVERACYTHSQVARELHEHMVGALRLIDGVTL